jgi:phage tail-like protein
VFTSPDGNPITPADSASDLARFLTGFTTTYDELAAAIDTILPDKRSKQTIRRLHDAYAESVGMPSEYTIGTAATARLARESGYIYRNKGTLSGIATYVEAVTGWQTTVTESTNKFLSLDDGSFEGTTGNWSTTGGTLTRVPVDGVTVTAANTLYNYETSTSSWHKAAVGLATMTGASMVMTLPGTADILKCIPVTAGQTYRFEVPTKRVTGTPTVTLAINWLTQTGSLVSTSTGTATATAAGWTAITYTAAAPATAAFAQLTVTLTGSATNSLHIDLMSFTDTADYIGGSFAYRDAQSVNIICQPTRTNLIYDPSFEDETFANWTATTGTLTIDAGTRVYGVGSGKVVGSTAYSIKQGDVGATPLVPYTISLWAKGAGATGTADLVWKDSGGVTLSTSTLTLTALTASFQRYEGTFIAPANTAKVGVVISGTGTVWLDAICLEQSENSPVFFSGATSDSSGADGSWVGAAAKTLSILYPSRPTKLARLVQTLDYYVPMQVGWRVLLWDSTDPEVRQIVTALAPNS